MQECRFELSNENIDRHITLIRETGMKYHAESRMLTTACISAEEILLNFQTRFDERQELRLKIGKRLNELVIRMELAGDCFDPRGKDSNDFGFILDTLDITPRYFYAAGINRVSVSLKLNQGKSELKLILGTVLLAAVLGFLGTLLPENVLNFCIDVIEVISSVILTLIQMAAMPVIFLCIVYGIIGSDSVSSFRENGLRTLGRMLLASLGMLLLTCVISIPAFGICPVWSSGGGISFEGLSDLLFSIIPDNIFSPFVNNNAIKIIILGVLFGTAILSLGEKTTQIYTITCQLKDICTLIMAWIGKLIPLLIFCVITDNVWKGNFGVEMFALWKIVVVYFAAFLLTLFYLILRVSRQKKLRISTVFSTVLMPGMKGLVSASSLLCYNDMEEGLREKLKVSESAVNFSIPLGLAFYHPIVIPYGVFLLFFAAASGVTVDSSWLITFLLVCFSTSLAAPPVSGGTVSLLTILFASLGISSPMVALAYPLFMLLDYPTTAFRVMTLMLEVAKE